MESRNPTIRSRMLVTETPRDDGRTRATFSVKSRIDLCFPDRKHKYAKLAELVAVAVLQL